MSDVAEIACLKHMVFMATTPPASQVSVTQSKVFALEKQLVDAEEQEREARDKRMTLASNVNHFRHILEELKAGHTPLGRDMSSGERPREPSPFRGEDHSGGMESQGTQWNYTNDRESDAGFSSFSSSGYSSSYP